MPRTKLHENIALTGLAPFALLLLWTVCSDGGTDLDRASDTRVDPVLEPPVETRIVAGDDQVRLPGSALVTELEVQAVDASGAPTAQAGLAVTWTPVSGGGSLDGMEALTDRNGKARAQWRLGPSLGDQTLEAAVSGTPAVTFRARAFELGPILFSSNLSADGNRVTWHLFAVDERGRNTVQITKGAVRDGESARSPDGSKVVFERVLSVSGPAFDYRNQGTITMLMLRLQ